MSIEATIRTWMDTAVEAIRRAETAETALAASQEENRRLVAERDNLWMALLHAKICFHGGVRSTNPDQRAHDDVDRALAGNGPKDCAALAAAKRAGRIPTPDRGAAG